MEILYHNAFYAPLTADNQVPGVFQAKKRRATTAEQFLVGMAYPGDKDKFLLFTWGNADPTAPNPGTAFKYAGSCVVIVAAFPYGTTQLCVPRDSVIEARGRALKGERYCALEDLKAASTAPSKRKSGQRTITVADGVVRPFDLNMSSIGVLSTRVYLNGLRVSEHLVPITQSGLDSGKSITCGEDSPVPEVGDEVTYGVSYRLPLGLNE
ncbi:hypothetical protein GCM10022631_07140 [Deinococcus rubellus]|uniref:hypothetical protein n=1 Tax=Deinococcus rubellus TaxID=1889240 RepID=UPI0031EA7E0B